MRLFLACRSGGETGVVYTALPPLIFTRPSLSLSLSVRTHSLLLCVSLSALVAKSNYGGICAVSSCAAAVATPCPGLSFAFLSIMMLFWFITHWGWSNDQADSWCARLTGCIFLSALACLFFSYAECRSAPSPPCSPLVSRSVFSCCARFSHLRNWSHIMHVRSERRFRTRQRHT